MKKFPSLLLMASGIFFFTPSFADVTITTIPVAATNISQGTFDNIVYIAKIDVTILPVTVNNILFTLTGTHNNTDLTRISIYFNASTPSLAGSSILTYETVLFAAPHTYSLSVFPPAITAGAWGYFIITVNTDAAASGGHTIKLDGAANPVIFSYTSAPTIINNQTDAAGTQTIQAAGVTLSTSPVAASSILQGSTDNIIYITRMDITTLSVTVNNILFTLSGTHTSSDLTRISIYFNASAPVMAGASILNFETILFAAPHTYSLAVFKPISAGSSGYFIITANINAAATPGHTLKLDGAINPVIFGYTSAPPVTDNQTDAAGTQTTSGTLPVTLLSFTANVLNTQEVKLQWITAGELNTKDFEVEWSDDGLHLSKIAVRPAAGNSTQNLHYSYLHKLPVDGNNYYRLKMFDIDGRFTYSPVIKVHVAITTAKIAIFPNPVIEFLQLQVQAIKNETLVFYLHNADGKAIVEKSFTVIKGNNRLSWNLQRLASGTYFISSGNNIFETIKIFKY